MKYYIYYPCYVGIIFWYTILKRIPIKQTRISWKVSQAVCLFFRVSPGPLWGSIYLLASKKSKLHDATSFHQHLFCTDLVAIFRLKSGFWGGQGPWKFNSLPLRIHHSKGMHSSNHHFLGEKWRGRVVPSENMDIECPGSKKNISAWGLDKCWEDCGIVGG